MRNIFYTLCTALFWVSSVASAQELKLGFVNVAKIAEEAPQAEAARSKLEKEFAPRDKGLGESQKQLKVLEDKLAKDGAVISEAERAKAEREILSQRRDLKRSQDEFREDFNIRRNEEFAKLQKLVADTIVSLAKKESYDLIVGDGTLYASDRVDITDKVLEALKGAKGAEPAAPKKE